MEIRFWGVRGSIAVSGTEYLRTGGNTPCIELLSQGERLILDGGTGLRGLGQSLGVRPVQATLLFTHQHWDHIQGVPFFGPAYHPDSNLTFAGIDRGSSNIREALGRQMRPPHFPITIDAMRAAKRFVDLRPGEELEVGPFRVTPLEQEHPDGVATYRIEAEGRSLVLATDVEHRGRIDRAFLDFAQGADLLIHDAQYTPDEYDGRTGPPRRGWGHATWCEAVSAAVMAAVRRLALFHHDPERADDQVAVIESWAQERFPAAFAAREGVALAL